MINSKSKRKNTYSSRYYEDRDYLDLRMAESIKILMNENKLKSVLDVGCGTGLLVKFLKEHNIQAEGCDIETEAIKTAKKINNIRIIKASATKLTFKKNTFDLVTAISVIEHLTSEEVEKFIQETKRILKPKGFIFMVTPNYATPIRIIQGKKWFGYSDPTHINFYTPKRLAAVLKKNKFTNIKTSFKTPWGLSFSWDEARIFKQFPTLLANIFVYLLFSTPLSMIRNSFWMAAQKKINRRDG